MDKVANLLKLTPSDLSEEVSSDAVQLMLISTFNGVCALYPRLAAQGVLSEQDIRSVFEAMTPPLDHDGMIDDPTLAMARGRVDDAFAEALALIAPGASDRVD
jgi:hypothetical protein